MEFVVTEGQIQLQPIPGPELAAEPGSGLGAKPTRAGYMLVVVDPTGAVVRVTLPYRETRQLGEVIIKDTDEHEGYTHSNIEVAQAVPDLKPVP